jgi:ribosome maturation factor RimP
LGLTEGWFQEVIGRQVEDVELVVFEEVGNRRHRVLRLFIDHPDGVTHDLCARVSGVVGAALDEADIIDGAYTLEVSSPGIERPLRKRSHFEAQVGKLVHVRTRTPVEGSKVWQGILLEVAEEAIVIQESGRQARIPLEEIASAHLVYEFR